jgi:hypothetical protein
MKLQTIARALLCTVTIVTVMACSSKKPGDDLIGKWNLSPKETIQIVRDGDLLFMVATSKTNNEEKRVPITVNPDGTATLNVLFGKSTLAYSKSTDSLMLDSKSLTRAN